MTGESRERPGWSADARTPLRPGSLLPQLAAVVAPLIVHRHIGPKPTGLGGSRGRERHGPKLKPTTA